MAFQQQAGISQYQDLSPLEAFIEASKMMEPQYFWPYLLKRWFLYCASIFIACGLLLAVVKPSAKFKYRAANKAES